MKIKLNVVIFSIGKKIRKNNRSLDEKKLKILLSKNKSSKLILPTFDFDDKENILTTLKKNVKNILNTENIYFEQLYTWGEREYYTKDNQLTISYIAIVNEENSVLNTTNYNWYTVDINDLSNDAFEKVQKFTLSSDNEHYEYNLKTERTRIGITYNYIHKFDKDCILDYNHSIILMTALKRLRSNIEVTDLAFKFLVNDFTLTELQQIYEIVLDTKLDKGNFRKKISKMVTETKEIKKDASAHRPSKYFKLNENWIKDYV